MASEFIVTSQITEVLGEKRIKLSFTKDLSNEEREKLKEERDELSLLLELARAWIEAAKASNLTRLRDLLPRLKEKKISLEILDNVGSGRTALHAAAEKGTAECITFLLEQGLDLMALTPAEQTPPCCYI